MLIKISDETRNIARERLCNILHGQSCEPCEPNQIPEPIMSVVKSLNDTALIRALAVVLPHKDVRSLARQIRYEGRREGLRRSIHEAKRKV